eukprot:4322594-Amphidinium_carterae.1
MCNKNNNTTGNNNNNNNNNNNIPTMKVLTHCSSSTLGKPSAMLSKRGPPCDGHLPPANTLQRSLCFQPSEWLRG